MNRRLWVLLLIMGAAFCPLSLSAAPPLLAIALIQESSLKPAIDAWQNQDYALARQLADPLAAQGDPDAQFLLAELYDKGLGGAQDEALARSLYVKAAMAGHVHAQFMLGDLAFTGRGVAQDFSRAADWFTAAANGGHALAKTRLGLMYFDGLGVKKDLGQAAALFEDAANLGDASAQYHLGLMYLTGEGKPFNYASAAKWFEKAALQGDGDSQYNYALILEGGLICTQSNDKSCQADPTGAVFWMSKAAENNILPAFASMGLLAYNGRGMEQSYEMAADWFEKSADKGDPEGMFFYAVALAEGKGRERNLDLAFSWAQKSVAASQKEAEEIRSEREALAEEIEKMIYQRSKEGAPTEILVREEGETKPSTVVASPIQVASVGENASIDGSDGADMSEKTPSKIVNKLENKPLRD
ncbi:MAG: SEL1-like repeat protein [bacterium]